MNRFTTTFLFLAAAGIADGAFAQSNLEVPSPNSVQSGIDAISGWHCTASKIEIVVDDRPPMVAGSRTERNDTRGVCGGRTDTGFSLLYNWNTLPTQCFGCRFHKVVALADGVPFATREFSVEHFGTEFMTGKTGEYSLNNFPEVGSIATLRWDEAKQNFAINLASRLVHVTVGGAYYGALRTGATNPACGPFPPNRVIGTKYGAFNVQYANNQFSLAIDYADGTTCRLPAVAVQPIEANNQEGNIVANYDGAAAAACPEFPNGVTVRANGSRLVADSKDMCLTAHVFGAK